MTSGDALQSATIDFCEVDAASVGGGCIGPTWAATDSRIVDHAHLIEDPRYIVQALATGLNASTAYRFTVSVVLAGGATARGSTAVRTVPGLESNETVVLLGGGDYRTDEEGLAMLRAGLQAAPDAQVLYFGGDLSYANNMRTCYLRWDRFLHGVSALVNGEGLSLPLLTIPGNHEAGGYLEAGSDRDEYYFYAPYFPQFDDDHPADRTITYHSHRLGRRLGVVALDSGTMVPVGDQTAYLRDALVRLRGYDAATGAPNASALAAAPFLVTMWHNAAYGATPRDEADPVALMREQWLPVLDAQKVPLALEFHEHVFKRTFPMNQGVVRRDGDGVTFVGDGALGVQSSSRTVDRSQTFLAAADERNYITAIRVLANGSCTVSNVDASGFGHELFDTVTLQRRV